MRSTTDSVLQGQWDRCNCFVLSWLLNSVSEELYTSHIFSTIASNVWNVLKETYCKIDGSVIYNLHKQINSITQNGLPISEYYHKLNSLWRQYDNLTKLPQCKCEAFIELNEFNNRIKLMQFLMGLDDVYKPIRTSLLAKDPLSSIKSAFATLVRNLTEVFLLVLKANLQLFPPSSVTLKRNKLGGYQSALIVISLDI